MIADFRAAAAGLHDSRTMGAVRSEVAQKVLETIHRRSAGGALGRRPVPPPLVAGEQPVASEERIRCDLMHAIGVEMAKVKATPERRRPHDDRTARTFVIPRKPNPFLLPPSRLAPPPYWMLRPAASPRRAVRVVLLLLALAIGLGIGSIRAARLRVASSLDAWAGVVGAPAASVFRWIPKTILGIDAQQRLRIRERASGRRVAPMTSPPATESSSSSGTL